MGSAVGSSAAAGAAAQPARVIASKESKSRRERGRICSNCNQKTGMESADFYGMRYNAQRSGRGSVRLEHSVRDREVGGSNPPAPTKRGD